MPCLTLGCLAAKAQPELSCLDRFVMVQWAVHFSCRLAAIREADGQLHEAEEHLQSMAAHAAKLDHAKMQVRGNA